MKHKKHENSFVFPQRTVMHIRCMLILCFGQLTRDSRILLNVRAVHRPTEKKNNYPTEEKNCPSEVKNCLINQESAIFFMELFWIEINSISVLEWNQCIYTSKEVIFQSIFTKKNLLKCARDL